MFLSCVSITFISNTFLLRSFNFCKSSEFGIFNNFINNSIFSVITVARIFSFKLFSLNSLLIVFISSFLLLFMFVLLLCNINYYVQLLLVISFKKSITENY